MILTLNEFDTALVNDLLEEFLAQTEEMIECTVSDRVLMDTEEDLLGMSDFIYRRQEAAERLHKELNYHA